MTPNLVWLVGEPGVGKTTLVRTLLRQQTTLFEEIIKPKFTLFFDSKKQKAIAAAGFWRGNTFDGADTLPISQIKLAIQYWKDSLQDFPITILDGDKLANAGAVAVTKETSAVLHCFLLKDEDLAERRRFVRNTKQNAGWVKGRRTKAYNFWSAFSGNKHVLDANGSTENLINIIYEKLL